MIKRVSISPDQKFTKEELAELEMLKLMPDEDICLDDDDCPVMSPGMQKSFECAVALRNRMRKIAN
jgi:hypothetical protein